MKPESITVILANYCEVQQSEEKTSQAQQAVPNREPGDMGTGFVTEL